VCSSDLPIPAQMLAQMNQARAWFGDEATKEDGVAPAVEPTPQQVADATSPSNEEDTHQT